MARAGLAAIAGALLALLAGAAPAAGALTLTPLVSGVGEVTDVAFAPGQPRRTYIVDQDGLVLVRVKGKLRAEPFLDLRGRVSGGFEQGLLSIAFHPGYAANRRLYVYYTDLHGDVRIVEYRSDGKRALPGTARAVLTVEHPYENHNGGLLVFGPDGRLYAGLGDGGGAGDPENRAQDLSTLLGKLIRIDVDDPAAAPEIVAYGLRNPWRYSFDRLTGDLWIGDVGQNDWEEVDVLPAGTVGLVNFGWDAYEGNAMYEEKSPNPAGQLLYPVAVYGHENETNCAITGGFVYRGAAVPEARGRYFYGDFCSGAVWSLVRDASGRAADVRREPFTVPGLSTFGEGPKGELYLASRGGDLYRLSAG